MGSQSFPIVKFKCPCLRATFGGGQVLVLVDSQDYSPRGIICPCYLDEEKICSAISGPNPALCTVLEGFKFKFLEE